MPYRFQCQTTGTRRWTCEHCGFDNRHKCNQYTYRFRCRRRTCRRVTIIGSVSYQDVGGGAARRPPCDQAMPIVDESDGSRHTSGELDHAEESADPQSTEPAIAGGVWHTGEPVSFGMPNDLPQVWMDRATELVYAAAAVAMGTRYVVRPAGGSDHDRIVVGAREWCERCVRLDNQPRGGISP